jgi:hypothetical protein
VSILAITDVGRRVKELQSQSWKVLGDDKDFLELVHTWQRMGYNRFLLTYPTRRGKGFCWGEYNHSSQRRKMKVYVSCRTIRGHAGHLCLLQIPLSASVVLISTTVSSL